jgi:cell division protein ZapA (FtsZ GTPase activity inhibitor)
MEPRVVTVEIGGHRFPIRSTLEQSYVSELAAYVDGKMRAASEAAPAADGVGLAVLVALNLADELFRCRERQSSASGDLNERALRLEQLLDTVLAQPPARLRSSM